MRLDGGQAGSESLSRDADGDRDGVFQAWDRPRTSLETGLRPGVARGQKSSLVT